MFELPIMLLYAGLAERLITLAIFIYLIIRNLKEIAIQDQLSFLRIALLAIYVLYGITITIGTWYTLCTIFSCLNPFFTGVTIFISSTANSFIALSLLYIYIRPVHE